MPDQHVQRAVEKIAGARGRLLDLNKQLRAELHEAASAEPRDAYGQPLYSPAGLQEHRERLAATARERAKAQLDDIHDDVDRASTIISASADRARPTIGADAASQMAAQRAWDQVRLRLDAGMPLPQVIANANLDTLLAIREWAPSYLEAKSYREHTRDGQFNELSAGPWTPPETAPLMRAIDQRFARVLDDDNGSTVQTALDTAGPLAEIETSLRHVGSVVAGADPTQSDLAVPDGCHTAPNTQPRANASSAASGRLAAAQTTSTTRK